MEAGDEHCFDILLCGLGDLEEYDFKKFKGKLSDAERSDKIPRCKLQNADVPTLASLMIQHFGRKLAVTTAKRILRDLHLKEALNIMIEKEKAKGLSKAKGKKPLEKKLKSHPAKNTGQNTGSCKNQRTKNETMIKEPFVAKVIKVTKPFKYSNSDGKRNQVFHAVVLNASAKTRIRIFDVEKHPLFKKNKTIEISNYYKKEGYLQVVKHSICEIKEVELVIPKKMHKDAVRRTRIEDIQEMPEKSYVDGTFTVKKKWPEKSYTRFTVTDDTGELEVMAFGEVGNVKAAEGDRLQLTCFKTNMFNSKLQLKSEMHSRIQVIKQRKK
ncbi:gamma-interferon-inducible protein 16-like [Alligator sinensis]|uniref:Gamma-interferon-inducible protein 16-like n=1 Tax=Alligator sinensis TaxID=38654 RepID=A0A1U7SFN3_ALLSI|nr:gamma-interferon-inducible protein 16-like [Alligator sinensis]